MNKVLTSLYKDARNEKVLQTLTFDSFHLIKDEFHKSKKLYLSIFKVKTDNHLL